MSLKNTTNAMNARIADPLAKLVLILLVQRCGEMRPYSPIEKD